MGGAQRRRASSHRCRTVPRISRRARARKREFSVYAIVRCGGRQEKASVDDVLTIDKLAGEVGSSVTLPAVLVVDDDEVISDPAKLGGYQVTAEIVGAAAGPKINMIQYKNKTGYRRRLGHRQKYTQVKITGIGEAKASKAKASAGQAETAKASTGRSSTPTAPPGRSSTAKASAGKTGAAASRKKD
jgi:large subunit ribosomal protein L21